MESDQLIDELEPVVAGLLERHLATAKEWFPHELVPWGRGRDFVPGEPWEAPSGCLDQGIRSALFVNLLTEDNLPYYTLTLAGLFGDHEAWGCWMRRWTAEEGRHSIVLRDYLTVTRALDPVELERGRMAQVECAQVPQPGGAHNGLVYVTLQELATRVAHLNTGKLLGDDAGYEVVKRIAADENRHHLFYRDLASAAFEIDPSSMVIAAEDQVRKFEMPGFGIPDFGRHAKAIARAGIYDLRIHHDQILVPIVLRHWRIDQLEGLTDAAEQARDALLARIERTGDIARRMERRRAEAAIAS